MKNLIYLAFTLILGMFTVVCLNPAFAETPFGTGYYTNLCGSGQAATSDTCNQGCDTARSVCAAQKPYVVKFVCDGKQTSCRNNATSFETTQSVGAVGCGKTAEIDVYKKKCQTPFGWFCSESDRLDYMVWYSGDCAGSPTTPMETPMSSQGSCTSLTAPKGNNSIIPATVSLHASGSDSRGPVGKYLFFFGDGQQEESVNPEIQHRYESSGTFSSRVFIRDGSGNWITSGACQAAVTVTASALETRKSGCSNLFILSGNYSQAPSPASFQVTGFDNKGGIQKYKVDFGNGQSKESSSGLTSYTYRSAGSFTARGYVLDSQNIWQTSDSCVRPVYIATQGLTRQPDTGTPTWFTALAVVSGITGVSLFALRGRHRSK